MTKETYNPDCPPPQPPVGTWVKDRYGGTSYHQVQDGWGQPGIMPFGKWEAMWEARGPLTECGPWGEPLPEEKPLIDAHNKGYELGQKHMRERVLEKLDEWMATAGPGTRTEQVFGPQTVSLTFLYDEMMKVLNDAR